MKNKESKLSLEDFVKKTYPIIVREILDKIHIFDPKLHIFVDGDTFQGAYESYQKEKISFYSRLESIDALHLIPALSDVPTLKQRVDLQKILIERFCSFLLTLVFWVLLLAIIFHQVNKTTSKISEAFIPVEAQKREERLQRFKEKLEVVAPYMREVKKVFNE